jgi:hypothetical protein
MTASLTIASCGGVLRIWQTPRPPAAGDAGGVQGHAARDLGLGHVARGDLGGVEDERDFAVGLGHPRDGRGGEAQGGGAHLRGNFRPVDAVARLERDRHLAVGAELHFRLGRELAAVDRRLDRVERRHAVAQAHDRRRRPDSAPTASALAQPRPPSAVSSCSVDLAAAPGTVPSGPETWNGRVSTPSNVADAPR